MRNRILGSLQDGELRVLLPDLQRFFVDKGLVLTNAGEPITTFYFPETAVIAAFGKAGENRQMELWSVGDEGMASTSGIFATAARYREVVQVGGEVLALQA